MAEEDELVLRVRLDDQATASLQKLRGSMQEMGGGKQQAERQDRSQKQAAESARAMGVVMGRAAGIAQALTGELIKMGASFVSRATDLQGFAEGLRKLEHGARAAGLSMGEFKNQASAFKMAGVSAEAAQKNIQGFTEALVDLSLTNSQVRQQALFGLRGAEKQDMINFFKDLETKPREAQINMIRQRGLEIEEFYKKLGGPAAAERGATAKQRWYNILGMPDLDKITEDIKKPNEEYNKLLEARKKHGEEYLKFSKQTEKSLDHSADALKSIAFSILPINQSMEASAKAAKATATELEKIDAFLKKPREEQERILRERGERYRETLTPRGRDLSLGLQGDQPEGAGQQRFNMIMNRLFDLIFGRGWRGDRDPSLDSDKNNKKATEENTDQLKELNDKLDDPSTFGERFGFGDPLFKSRMSPSRWGVGLNFGSPGGALPSGASPSSLPGTGGGYNVPGGGGGDGGAGAGPGTGLKIPGSLAEGSNTVQEAIQRGQMEAAGGAGEQTYAGGTAKQKVAQTVANTFRAAGYNEKEIAGMLANIQSESGFDPTNRHVDQPKFSGEARYSHGLFQEGGDEWNNWSKWMQKKGLDPNTAWKDPKIQTQWIAERLNQPQYKKLREKMRNAKTKEEAAQLFVDGYLRPAAMHRSRRIAEYGGGVPGVESYTGAGKAGAGGGGGFKPFTTESINRAVRGEGDTAGGASGGADAVRGGRDLRGVDPRLVEAIHEGSKFLPPGYTIRPTSGLRPGDSGFHGKGAASDWQIYGPDGKPLANRGWGEQETRLHALVARGAYGHLLKTNPALAKRFEWGGAFPTGKGGQGPPDLMHYDFGGRRGRWSSRQVQNMGPLYLDRAAIDRGGTQNVNVNGSGQISVNVRAPEGTTVSGKSSGLFKRMHIKRENTAMAPAEAGPNTEE